MIDDIMRRLHTVKQIEKTFLGVGNTVNLVGITDARAFGWQFVGSRCWRDPSLRGRSVSLRAHRQGRARALLSSCSHFWGQLGSR